MLQSKCKYIFETLKRKIVNGECDFTKPLPSVVSLMKKFGAARATVAAALKLLQREGLVKSCRGAGTYPVKRKTVMYGMIIPERKLPFYAQVCKGITDFLKSMKRGTCSILRTNAVLETASQLRSYARMCVESQVVGVFFARFHDARLNREILKLFRDAEIPVMLLGGKSPSLDMPYDLIGMNRIVNGRSMRIDLSSSNSNKDSNVLAYGEMFGRVAIRLMLQRLSYPVKVPSTEVFLVIPPPPAHTRRKDA